MTDAASYLLVVFEAERRGTSPVAPGHVADALGKSPSATTEMLQRLATRGLVRYEPYQGVTLTAEGRETTEELFDTYRTLVRFFRDVLHLDEYQSEARELAGRVSPLVTQRLDETLLAAADADDVATDPEVPSSR